MSKHVAAQSAPTRSLTRSAAYPLTALLFLAFLALYTRTAAPSVLSGDSAEFQLAAPMLGVPHPTTYPLYMLLGKLATLAIPFGDLAWRVTIVSAVCGALAVALFFLLARQITGSAPAALVGALALGLAPGLWNVATMAEVYALLMALLTALICLIVTGRPPTIDQRPTTNDQRPTTTLLATHPPSPIPHPPSPIPHPWWRLRLAALVGGLGFTHHGLFVIVGLPLLAGYLLWLLVRRGPENSHLSDNRPSSIVDANNVYRLSSSVGPVFPLSHDTLRQGALLALCFGAGLLPWLYTLAQYARYGPFTGADYGLPRHYFWGAPESWGQALDLLTGGPMRRGIFRPPTLEAVSAVLHMVGRRLLFEFGPIGVPLGLLGSVALLRQARLAWAGAAWVFFATLSYLLLLGPAVQDAPVFTLPMLLPWALWIAAGSAALIEWGRRTTKDERPRTNDQGRMTGDRAQPDAGSPAWVSHRRSSVILVLLIAATLAWGYTRVQVSSKRQLWLFRRFGEATLDRLPPGAAVIAHWEQGMTLQYLIRVEGRRPDIWVDVVEPSDASWGERARRYGGRAVFFVGVPADVEGLPVRLVREEDYADVFELRK